MKKTSAVHGPQPWPPEEHKVMSNLKYFYYDYKT